MKVRDFIKDQSGVAAVEFALISIVLMALLLSIIDISRAISRQMDLNSTVRSGAELSMRGRDEAAVETAIGEVFSRTVGAELTSVDVQKFCICPTQNISAAPNVGCNTICSGNYAPWAFHDIDAAYTHESLFLRRVMDYRMSYAMRVQVP